MDMFGFGTALRGMMSRRAAARRIRQMERVHVDLPATVRIDMGLDQNRNYFVPLMLNK
jgi:hypothetical protein